MFLLISLNTQNPHSINIPYKYTEPTLHQYTLQIHANSKGGGVLWYGLEDCSVLFSGTKLSLAGNLAGGGAECDVMGGLYQSVTSGRVLLLGTGPCQ